MNHCHIGFQLSKYKGFRLSELFLDQISISGRPNETLDLGVGFGGVCICKFQRSENEAYVALQPEHDRGELQFAELEPNDVEDAVFSGSKQSKHNHWLLSRKSTEVVRIAGSLADPAQAYLVFPDKSFVRIGFDGREMGAIFGESIESYLAKELVTGAQEKLQDF